MTGVLIVSDVQIFREGLAVAVSRDEGVQVSQAASRMGEAVRVIRRKQPKVALIDMLMPEHLQVMSGIAEDAPEVSLIVMGIGGDPQQVLSCAEAGASGFGPREASLKDLMRAIADARDGALRCAPEITHMLCCHVGRIKAQAQHGRQPKPKQSTRRERQILDLIERGQPNKSIARDLGIELSTVKKHVHSLLAKMGVRRRGRPQRCTVDGPKTSTTKIAETGAPRCAFFLALRAPKGSRSFDRPP